MSGRCPLADDDVARFEVGSARSVDTGQTSGRDFGETHHRARLSDDQVREMRRLYEDWKANGLRKGYATLAAIFGCGESTARDIVTYRTRWAA